MGHNTNNVIVINGKRYDAVSGALVTETIESSPAPVPKAVHAAHPVHQKSHAHTVSLDGVVRTPTPYGQQPNAHHKNHASPHKPQKSSTLMRSAVKKPDIKPAAVIKSQSRTDVAAYSPNKPVVQPKVSYAAVNPHRHKRAEHMVKSPAISKYNHAALTGIQPKLHATAQQVQAPLLAQSAHQPSIASVKTPPKPPAMNMFERAIAEAQTHEIQEINAPLRSPRRKARMFGIVASSIVALFLIGFLTYQNVPSLSLKVASYRAGVPVKLPSYEPYGFAFQYLDYNPGNVTVNYASDSDNRQFNITQKISNWDSQALLNNFVTSANSAYKTHQQAGRTVYLMGNDTATWVDSGIWYTVNGNSSLSSKELLELAGSM